MPLGDDVDAVRADGKERICQRGYNETDRSRLDASKRPSQLVGPITEALDRRMHSARRFWINNFWTIEDTRDRHRPDVSQSCNLGHRRWLHRHDMQSLCVLAANPGCEIMRPNISLIRRPVAVDATPRFIMGFV